MGEEAAKERCPSNLPGTHVCLHQLTAGPPLGHGWWIECTGFSPLRQWVQHGSGTGKLREGTAFHSLEGLLSLRLNSRTHQSPSPAAYPGGVPVTQIDQLWAYPSHPHLSDSLHECHQD